MCQVEIFNIYFPTFFQMTWRPDVGRVLHIFPSGIYPCEDYQDFTPFKMVNIGKYGKKRKEVVTKREESLQEQSCHKWSGRKKMMRCLL